MWQYTVSDSYFLQPTASSKGWKLCKNPYLYKIALYCYHRYRNVQNQITRFYFRLKNNILWLLLNYSVWQFRQFSNVFGVCIRNQSSEDRTSVVSLAFWLVLPFRERRILYGSSKKNTTLLCLFISTPVIMFWYCSLFICLAFTAPAKPNRYLSPLAFVRKSRTMNRLSHINRKMWISPGACKCREKNVSSTFVISRTLSRSQEFMEYNLLIVNCLGRD